MLFSLHWAVFRTCRAKPQAPRGRGCTLASPPDLEPEQPVLEEPREFDVGSFEAFGEREDDIDIEEID